MNDKVIHLTTVGKVSPSEPSVLSKFQFWETIRWDIPAFVLALLLITWMISLVLVQSRKDFDFADIYRDDVTNKASLVRVTAMGAWVATTWIAMQDALDGVVTPEIFWGYLLGWSGAKVLEKLGEKWNGVLPFGKGS